MILNTLYTWWHNVCLCSALRSIISLVRNHIVQALRFWVVWDVIELISHAFTHIIWVHNERFVGFMCLILSSLRGMSEWYLSQLLLLVVRSLYFLGRVFNMVRPNLLIIVILVLDRLDHREVILIVDHGRIPFAYRNRSLVSAFVLVFRQ